MTQTPWAGWYADPLMVNTLRYWDGTQWTEHVCPMPPALPPYEAAPRVKAATAIRNFWVKAFSYSGRATRAEYNWALGLFAASYGAVLAVLVPTGLQRSAVGVAVIVAVLLAFVLPWPALIARRCHDINKPGVFGLLFLATSIGFLVTAAFLMFVRSDPRGARFDRGSAEDVVRRSSKRSRPLGFAACALVALALGAASFAVVEIAQVAARPMVILGQGPVHVTLPAHTQYGLFFYDPQNLGYSESCTASDDGQPVALGEPGQYFTSSEWDNLDLVFDTGSGNLVIDCQSTAQRVSVQPIPNFTTIFAGFGVGLAVGLAGAVCAVLWLNRVGARPGTLTEPTARTDSSHSG